MKTAATTKAAMKHVHTSRRTPTLIESDYDHRINLVDNDASPPAHPSSPTPVTSNTTDLPRGPIAAEISSTKDPRSLSPAPQQGERSEPRRDDELHPQDLAPEVSRTTGPSIEINDATPFFDDHRPVSRGRPMQRLSNDERQTAIDILFENERGIILCGFTLFSSKALGNLDPPPWTNEYHKPSPTDIHTAQLPDPTWDWAWPEWKINMDNDVDECGWIYSFMFSKKFSWHRARWYNSFVRRRAWIRKRVKKLPEAASEEPHMLNTDYFTVRPASEHRSHHRSTSQASMDRFSRVSSPSGEPLEYGDIEEAETLATVLRRCRIDREKIDALDNYLENANDDLAYLRDEMHAIMKLFVFQSSRRRLLSRLKEVCEKLGEGEGQQDAERFQRRKENLAGAIKQAEEDVGRMAYWSDIKGLGEDGEKNGESERKAKQNDNGGEPVQGK